MLSSHRWQYFHLPQNHQMWHRRSRNACTFLLCLDRNSERFEKTSVEYPPLAISLISGLITSISSWLSSSAGITFTNWWDIISSEWSVDERVTLGQQIMAWGRNRR